MAPELVLSDLSPGTDVMPGTEGRQSGSALGNSLPQVARERIHRFDAGVDAWFDRLRGNPTVDRVFYGASTLGDFSVLWHLLSLGRVVADPSSQREAVRMATALAVESVAVNVGIKSLFRRERPSWDHDRPHDLRRPRSSSFPSGHATSGFLAASLLAAGRPRQRAGWFGLASVVAASRIHVRIHHASDVLGGALLGLAFGGLVRRHWPVHPFNPRTRGSR